MKRWKITGFVATVVIIFSIPFYLFKINYITPESQGIQQQPTPTFVGSRKCVDCHKNEYDAWRDSQHDHAMDVAGDRTVLGNFNQAVFKNHGIASRFYRKDGKFFVHTLGPGGRPGEFEIRYTFGWYPLQQYLVPFPGGRLQCLPIAWDVERKRWYSLNPDKPVDPKDWLYWTNGGQNWNSMCAECHSTNLKKSYDITTDTYRTTWSDIDVGCEACHGPGSRHVKWAELPAMARPPVDNYDLAVKTSGLSSRKLVELCAPCHSRRAILGDYNHAEPDLLHSLLPSLLTQGLYFPDGQILAEDYVYGSFTQSKMYHRDVRCTDCHDVHRIKLVKQGNGLCLQCHRAAEYDTKAHHFHKKKGEKGEAVKSADGRVSHAVGSGSECIQCHMPGRYYMGVDFRRDHSLRVPRPDLSVKIGVPNACNRCHEDKTVQWSDNYITKWYGPGRKRHYATVIEAGRRKAPGACKALIRLAADPLYPVIVRATALNLLKDFPGKETAGAYALALMDEEPLIRRTAIENLNESEIKEQIKIISPLLYDPVKAVRIEAAYRLAGEPSEHLDAGQRKMFVNALKEFVASMEYSADFASSRFNLGNLHARLNETEEAVSDYQAAIRIDDLFYPAKVNLAMLYNRTGADDKAEQLLREVVRAYPHLYDIDYSLGLLLAEKKKNDDALLYLEKAARGMPGRARIHYNLGLLLASVGQDKKAERSLLKALEMDPDNRDYLFAAAEFYLKRKRLNKARIYAEQLVSRYPKWAAGHRMLDLIGD